VGGELRRLAQTTVGPLTRLTIEQLHVAEALIGTIRLGLEAGLTPPDPTEAYTKELVMEHAREVILLADSSKAHKISFTRAGRLEKVRVLITDRLIDRKLSKELRKRGMEVVLA